jgi:hypothetical protein
VAGRKTARSTNRFAPFFLLSLHAVQNNRQFLSDKGILPAAILAITEENAPLHRPAAGFLCPRRRLGGGKTV